MKKPVKKEELPIGELMFALGLMFLMAGAIRMGKIKTQEDFDALAKKLEDTFGEYMTKKQMKPIADMDIKELSALLQKRLKKEDYETCAEIKKLIEYKQSTENKSPEK